MDKEITESLYKLGQKTMLNEVLTLLNKQAWSADISELFKKISDIPLTKYHNEN